MKNRVGVLFLLGLLLAAGVPAQQQAPVLFQFRISNPGARSLGFGGAFAALADDATAAYANPAGLVQLLRPELSVELRVTAVSEPGTGGSIEDFSGVGFTSFVYPLKRLSLAVYNASLGKFEDDTFVVGNFGLAGAYRFTDQLSFGFGLSRFEGEFAATTRLVSFVGPIAESRRLAASGMGDDLRWNAGVLWNLPRRFTLGGFFRQGPSFDLSAVLIAEVVPGVPPGTVLGFDPRVPLDLADVFGLGASYRSPNGVVTVSFEWDRLQSARVLEDGDELHLGVELALIKTSPFLALRLGTWQDSDRRVQRFGSEPVPEPLLPVGDGEAHVAAGIGLAFKKLKLDLGADHSELVDTVSFSMVYSF